MSQFAEHEIRRKGGSISAALSLRSKRRGRKGQYHTVTMNSAYAGVTNLWKFGRQGVGDCTRECLALVADISLSGTRVARELDRLVIERGRPKMVVSDNGSELTSNAILAWAHLSCVAGRTTFQALERRFLRKYCLAVERLKAEAQRKLCRADYTPVTLKLRKARPFGIVGPSARNCCLCCATQGHHDQRSFAPVPG